WGWGIIARVDDVTEVRLDGRETMAYTHNHPQDLNDGWQVDDLASVGLDHDQVKNVITNIAFTDNNNDFRSLLVARYGKLVVEQYFNSYRPETIHDVRSAGKSVTGALVGIAVDMDLIDGPDEQVIPFFDEYPAYANKGNDKEEITLEHLLNMSAGFDADANDGRTPGSEGNLINSDNFVEFILDLPMRFTPGEQYLYNSASAYLAGAMVEKASGETLSDFADDHLFGPLGIQQYFWTKGPMNTTFAMGGLFMTARDFAKIGQLYVNEGEWNGQRVLSSSWIEETLESKFELDIAGLQTGYSRLWLSGKRQVMGRDFDVYYASGNGGNIVAIVPSLELVVAVQQSAYGQGFAHYRAFQAIDGMIAACLVE
ncbi:MAG: serine hydrolase domain-containing protein, partial [Rhodothermales bacterium]